MSPSQKKKKNTQYVTQWIDHTPNQPTHIFPHQNNFTSRIEYESI